MSTKQIIEEKVFSYMEKHHMLNPHDRVVVGVSGGADSVCLLFVLLEYQKRVPLSLAVVHVNHGIRAEAGQDAGYVEKLCKEHDIPFYPYSVDVRRMAKERKYSEEEAGRIARYQAFEQTAKEYSAEKIAVAHNSNDRSETMLFNLFRGSGLKGLSGIRPVRGQIVRPILCLERKEVEAYLEVRGIPYCRDATNEKDDYTRNRIRHHILPYAEEQVVTGCVSHMAQTAEMLAETEEYLEQQTEAAMKECLLENVTENVIKIEIEAFRKNHRVLQQRMLYAAVMSLTPSGKDITYIHIQSLLTLFTETGNRSISLPFGIVGRRQYDKVILECRQNLPEISNVHPKDVFYAIKKEEIDTIQENGAELIGKIPLEGGEVLELRLLPKASILGDFPTNQYTKWFDYDKIEKSMDVRIRQVGDYLSIAGKGGEISHKSLKDYMITEKIPQNERNRIPMLADGHHVVWLIGYRISEYYKISRNTKRILQVQLIGRDCGSSGTEDKNG